MCRMKQSGYIITIVPSLVSSIWQVVKVFFGLPNALLESSFQVKPSESGDCRLVLWTKGKLSTIHIYIPATAEETTGLTDSEECAA